MEQFTDTFWEITLSEQYGILCQYSPICQRAGTQSQNCFVLQGSGQKIARSISIPGLDQNSLQTRMA